MSALTTTPVAATGPRTPEGKAASSQNATSHGLTSGRIVLAHEDDAAFQRLLESYRDEFGPATPHEEYLVRQMVDARWRLDRAKAIEAAALEIMIFGDACEDTPEHRIAKIMVDKGGDVLNQLQRYAAALERSYHRAHRELWHGIKVQRDIDAKNVQTHFKEVKAEHKAAETALLNYINAPLPEIPADYKTNPGAPQRPVPTAPDARNAPRKPL